MQVHNPATGAQHLAVTVAHHRPAAGGDHHAVGGAEFGEHGLLTLAETDLALDIEDPWDIRAAPLFDLLVGVLEREMQLLGEQAPDGALSAPIGPTRIRLTTLFDISDRLRWPDYS